MGKPQKRTEALQQIAVELYKKLGSGNAVAKRLQISPPTAYQMLRDAGLNVPDGHSPKPNRMKLDAEKSTAAVKDYQEGMSLEDLEEKYGVSQWTIRDRVKRAGLSLRKIGGKRRPITPSMKADFIALYKQGVPQIAISAKYGCHQATVSVVLRRAGFPAKRVRDKHGSWQGGIAETVDGYILESIPHDDPMVKMTRASGYCLQHRLVMARYLGRPLEKHETVHHIDGNRKNNKIENLQLRIGKHGNGVAYKCSCCGSLKIEPTSL